MIGARILSGGKFPLLRLAEEIAFTHHERWDGERLRGHPRRRRPARRADRRGGRRLRRADPAASLQAGLADRRGDRPKSIGSASGSSIRRWSTPSCA